MCLEMIYVFQTFLRVNSSYHCKGLLSAGLPAGRASNENTESRAGCVLSVFCTQDRGRDGMDVAQIMSSEVYCLFSILDSSNNQDQALYEGPYVMQSIG